VQNADAQSSLTLSKVKTGHAGVFSVKISNVAGTAESAANLQIAEKSTGATSAPVFRQKLPESLEACTGDQILMEAHLDNKCQVLWFKVGCNAIMMRHGIESWFKILYFLHSSAFVLFINL